MSYLYVRNNIQRALFRHELMGQISDGYWENSRPYDHYKPWCHCEIVVRPEKVGRDFYAQRTRYNFTSPELLDCVGDRMLAVARVAASGVTDDDVLNATSSCYDMTGTDFEACRNSTDWRKTYVKAILSHFETFAQFLMVTTDTNLLTMARMKKELTDLKRIIKNEVC